MIRTAQLADGVEIEKLWRAWWDEFPVPNRELPDLMAEQRNLLHDVITGARQGVALYVPGEGVLLWAGAGRELHGYGVYVTPAARKRGRGSELLAEGCKRAKELGFERIYVSPYYENGASLHWLTRAGFEPVQMVMGKEL